MTLNSSWKQFAAIENGDGGNYWQRNDGNAEIAQDGPVQERRGEGFHLNVWQHKRMVYVGTYATLEQAMSEADYRIAHVT